MKIIPKHMMMKHAGVSLVLLYLPIIMAMGGLLGGIGYGMTLIGFLLNFPGVLILKVVGGFLPPRITPLVMVLLTELIVFVIPKYIIDTRKKAKESRTSG